MADEQQLADELVITLRKPVEFAGESHTQLVLREPTGAEMLQWDRLSGVEADIKAVAIVSGLPEPVVKQIGARDLIQAGRYLAAFLS